MASLRFTLPRWHDLHAHFRQGALLQPLLKAHADMGCAGILAMPNTSPPVGKALKSDPAPYWSIEEYLQMIRVAGGDSFEDVIVPLYLTQDTTPAMIAAGAKAGVLRAVKYYPPHGTTGAGFGRPLETYMKNGVLEALAEHNVILCVHGEEHGLQGADYFDSRTNAEDLFYRERMPGLVSKYPTLKIVAEHLSTKTAVDFVRQAGANVAATITPQHLLYTVGHLLQGLKYHLYCLPLLKFEEDRQALLKAVTDLKNTKFFAGTDSAPHTKKATACGCAAGCFTGGIAPQLYAMAFELVGVDLSATAGQEAFKRFLCTIGPAFYGLPMSKKTFALAKEEQSVEALKTPDGDVTPLTLGLCPDGKATLPWRIEL